MNTVTVIGNSGGYGVLFNMDLTHVIPITISNSDFSRNSGSGLVALLNGPFLFTNVSANHNGGYGLQITNNLSAKAPITITISGSGTSDFSSNGQDGLNVSSFGNIVVHGVSASYNNSVSGNNGIILVTAATASISITNSAADYNVNGIYAQAGSGFTMDGVSTNNNTQTGTFLFSNGSTHKPATITRSTFNTNGADGLAVVTDGMIIVNNLTANGNVSDNGVSLNNSGTIGANVTILSTYGPNTFTNNGNKGLSVTSGGTIIANGIVASSNMSDGADFDNTVSNGTISINNSLFKYNQGSNGLYILSNNSVTLNSIQSYMNGFFSGNGLTVDTYNHNLNITNSSFVGNDSAGIYATVGTGIVSLVNTNYYGNVMGIGTSNLIIN
jgi:hypothetical protein